MREKIYIVIFYTVAVVFHTTFALAGGDAKIYPGYQCRETVPDTVYYTWGAVFNKTDQTISVICPIPRDEGGIARGWIRFIDQIPNSNPGYGDGITDIACYLSSYTWMSGDNSKEALLRITSYVPYFPPPGVSQSHAITIEFGPVPLEYDWDTYFMTCYIPGKYPKDNGKMSGIVSFRIEEYD